MWPVFLFTNRGNRGAMNEELITPVYEAEELKDAEARLQAFVGDIVPVLDGFIPGKDVE